MIKNILFFSVVVIWGLGWLGAVAYGQEDMVVVDHTAFGKARRSPARFVHDEHNEAAGLEDCAQCHHVYDTNGKRDANDSSEGQPCADCHALEDQGAVPGLRKAFHRSCTGCHQAQGSGPITCAQCHTKS
jgi:hypothetical protein